MEPSDFDEVRFFQALYASKARALLIGRRALVLLGLPVLTADYDFWVAIEDVPLLNGVAAEYDLRPTRTPEEARRHGRYALENDEHIDVLVARSVPTVDGVDVEFETLWQRRQTIPLADAEVYLPAIDDLILTKQFGTRAKDLEDIRLLRILKDEERRR
jgi:hypothetical protein